MDLANVRTVGKALIVLVHYKHIKTLAMERNPVHVELVVKPSQFLLKP